jgi:hypothetical protein
VLTEDDLSQIMISIVAQGRPAPTIEQMRNLLEAKVREEVLYREALAMGLDKDDVIRGYKSAAPLKHGLVQPILKSFAMISCSHS